MSMLNTFSRRMTVLAALAGATALAACGDDKIKQGPADAKIPVIDTAVIDGAPDAMPPDAAPLPTVAGTIAISDVKLVDPETAAVGGVSGGSILISFSDLTDGNGGTVVAGTTNIGSCVVTRFDSTHKPNKNVDGGAVILGKETLTISSATRASNLVTITTSTPHHLGNGDSVVIAGVTNASFDGTFASITDVAACPNASTTKFCYDQTAADATSTGGTAVADGRLKTIGPCAFVAAAGNQYLCISNNMTGATAAAQDTGSNKVVAYAFPGTCTTAATVCLSNAQCAVPGDTCDGGPFVGENLVGSALQINGFVPANSPFNSGTSAFPIIQQPNARTLVVIDPSAPGDGSMLVGAATLTYTVLNGANPIPTGGVANTNFLGAGVVTVTKADKPGVWPAISQAIDVAGEGFTLSDPGNPANVPLTAANDITFGCGVNPGTNCGHVSASLVKAMIISGRATKQDLTGLLPFQMPTEDPTQNPWLEFQCAYLGSSSAVLTKEALQAIIAFQPTRLEVRVLNVAGNILPAPAGNGATNTTNLLIGHGIVGHTDP